MTPPSRTTHGCAALVMGGLLAISGKPATSATLYVDGADPTCNNAGPGSAGNPFCTIQRAATKADPGDMVLVSPGIYREQVTPKNSGRPELPIVFQSTGPQTVVLGSIDLARADKWKSVSATTWRRPLNASPRQVMVDGVRLTAAASADNMAPNSFFFDVPDQLLFVDIGGPNPGLSHAVEASIRTYGFNLVGLSNVVIQGFELMNQNSACLRIQNSSGITVRNVTTSFAGTYGLRVESSTGPIVLQENTITDSLSNGIVLVRSTGVTVKDNRVNHCGFHGISVQSSSNNTVTGNVSSSNYRYNVRSATGIDLSQGSNGNTVTANSTSANQDAGIQVYSMSTGNLVARNVSYQNGDHGFDTNNSTGTRYLNNTSCRNFKDGFSVEGGSNNTSFANNIAMDNGLTTNEFDLYVDTLSMSGFSSDFDIFYRSGNGHAVKVNGVLYTTLGDFSAATGHEAHGINADPLFVGTNENALSSEGLNLRLAAGSPAIDSANSDASGFVARDRSGFSPADDPDSTNMGMGITLFADRGAFESNARPTADLRMSTTSGEIDLTVTADASGSSDMDDAPIESFSFDFGDGTVMGPQAEAAATHTYTTPGSFTVTMTVTDRGGKNDTMTSQVNAQDHPPGARLSVSPASGTINLPVRADASASRGTVITPISTYTFDFGDGTVVGPQAGAIANHTYQSAGTFTIIMTVINTAGDSTVTSSQVVAIDNAPAGALSVTPSLGITNLTVTADASGSSDNDATPIANYTFNFGDGTIIGPQASPFATHTYSVGGDFTITVTIKDTTGRSTTATAAVRAVVNSAPQAGLTLSRTVGRKPLIITADASGSTDLDPAPISTYSFDFGDGTVTGPQASPRASHRFTRKGVYTVTVTVTDTAGLNSQASTTVTIRKKGHGR